MSSQGDTQHDSDSDINMVGLGLTGKSEDLKLEESTRKAAALPPHNCICAYCTQQPGETPTYIKYANHKVFRAGKPMCRSCFNDVHKCSFSLKQFMKQSQDEEKQAMDGLDEGTTRITKRAALNPKRPQEEVHDAVAKLSKTEQARMLASTDFLATVANGIQGWYVCRSETSMRHAKFCRVQDRVGRGWRNPTAEELGVLKADLNCSNLIVPMNHWFRG